MPDFESIRLRRGSESKPHEERPPTLWPQPAFDVFTEAGRSYKDEIRRIAESLARERGATVVTEAEINDARHRLVVGKSETSFIRICRIGSIVGVMLTGAFLSTGIQAGDAVLSAVSASMGIVLIVLQEFLRRYRV